MTLERILSTTSTNRNLVLRLVLALVVFPHGAQKLFGWFGGYGLTGTMGYFTDTVRVPYVLGFLVVLAESVGALALAAGFFTRVAAAGIGASMLGAMVLVHAGNGWFMNWFGTFPAGREGMEFFLPLLALSAVLVVEGAGRASVDAFVAARLRSPSLAPAIAIRCVAMDRAFSRVAAPMGLVLAVFALYACGPEETGSSDGTDAGGESSETGATGDDAAVPTNDGAASDSGLDGTSAKEGGADAALDAGDGAVNPGPPAVRFIGRFDTTPVAGPKTGFPHAQIIARFDGPEVKATFSDAMVYTDWGATRWEVLIDGVSQKVLSIARAQTQYTLAQGLAPGPHTVELVKLTEASVGITQFMGFDFPGGALLPPPPVATRHLEFLADSASNGYGIEGVNPCGFTGATQNARKSYPALVAADLAADHHNLAASGKGVYWNYTRGDPDVFAVVYPRTLPFTNGSTFDFASYTPDVVWMTLGGNDYSLLPNESDPPPPPPFASFESKYDELVTQVRSRRPNAHVVCAVAPSLTNAYPAGYNAYTNVKTAASNVVAAKVGAGDNKIYFFEFTRSTNGDLTGCQSHPNVTKHRAMADEAVPFIKSKTGWP